MISGPKSYRDFQETGPRTLTRKYFLSVGLYLAIHILSLIKPCSFVRLLFPFPNVLIHALPRIIAHAVN